jgi:XTP/dITP diphosphohydrolase
MKQLVFATHNKHKLAEVKALLKNHYDVIGLDDLGFEGEIAETGATFAENASLKTHFVYQEFKLDCFGDDSGLEVEALNQAPGIYSSRFSGGGDLANTQLVLQRLQGQTNRNARFRTVISLLQNGQEHFFEGQLNGVITAEPTGTGGFGYDPIFNPAGFEVTLAQMSMAEKNAISHRGLAMKKLLDWLFSQAVSS